MDNYAKSKKKLFSYVLNNNKNNKYAIFPSDDELGRKWYEEMPFDKKLSYGINFSSILKADNIQESKEKTTFTFSYLGKEYTITTTLPGKFNIQNILAAIGVAIEMGVPVDKTISSIENFQ